MPDNKKVNSYKDLPEEVRLQILKNVKTGLAAVEQDSRGYGSYNKQSKALGKYQFLPGEWWDDIQSYAKENGFEVNSHEDFLKSPSLQEGFMDHYVDTVIGPDAYRTYKKGKNPENLNLEDMMMFHHFQGAPKANKAITQGKSAWRGSTSQKDGDKVDNSSMESYLTKARGAIKSEGFAPVDNKKLSSSILLKEKGSDAIYKEYTAKRDMILYSNSNDEIQNQRMAELNREYVDKGLDEIINKKSQEKVAEYDKKQQEKYLSKKNNLEGLLNSLNSSEIFYSKKSVGIKADKDNVKLKENIVLDEEGYNSALALGLNPKKVGKNKYKVNLDSTFEKINSEYLNVTGKELGLSKDNFKTDNNDDFDFDANFLKNLRVNGIAEMLLPYNATSAFSGNIDVSDEIINNVRNGEAGKPEENIPYRITSSNTADPVKIEEIKGNDSEKEENKPKEETKPEEKVVPEEEKTTPDAVDPIRFDKIDAPQNFQYDKSKFGQGENLTNWATAAMGAGMAFKGFKDAKEEVPMRDEKLNDAFMDYVGQLKEMSTKGLSAAEEAAMKKGLTESYQVGVDNLTRASNGNRNLVLGNQGQLDNSRMNSIVEMELADAAKKERALNQWGDAQKYISEFDARRDIANTEMKQQLALEKRRDGKQLAGSGLNLLASSIDKAASEGPGSAKHMYKSYLLQDMYGYDPRMKDDGSGTVEGTRSHYEKNVTGKIKAMNENAEKFNSIYGGMNEDQKRAVGQVYKQDPYNVENVTKFAEYAKDKDDFSKMDMNNYGKALEGNNYDLMFRQNQSPIAGVASKGAVPNVELATAQQPLKPQPQNPVNPEEENIFASQDFLSTIADSF